MAAPPSRPLSALAWFLSTRIKGQVFQVLQKRVLCVASSKSAFFFRLIPQQIGGVAGGGGFLLLLLLGFLLFRWHKKRRSDYIPDQDELKCMSYLRLHTTQLKASTGPEMQEDSGALFPAAVRRNEGHGVGGLDRGDTMRSAGTAGVGTASSPTAYQPSNFSHGFSSGENAGLAAGAAAIGGAAGVGAYSSYPPRQSYYDPAQDGGYYQNDPRYNSWQPDENTQRLSQYDEGLQHQGPWDPAYDQPYEQGAYTEEPQRPTSGGDLDRYGSVTSRADRPLNLHVANA
jgi:hypothetical protein